MVPGWNTVATYAKGSSFNNGSFCVAAVAIPGSSLSNIAGSASMRRASSNGDQIYIDTGNHKRHLLRLCTETGGRHKRSGKWRPPHYDLGIGAVKVILKSPMRLYPNPAQSRLNLDIPEAMNVR